MCRPTRGGACGPLRQGAQASDRRRIVEAAGRRFKRDGIDGSGDRHADGRRGADQRRLLRPLRLQGRPRRHRRSPTSYAKQRESYCAVARSRRASSSSCASTCRSEHRDDREHGCPSAALLDEIGRCATATKHAYTDGVAGPSSTRSPPAWPRTIRSRHAVRTLSAVRAADRHAAALARPRRPPARRRGARAGHRERAGPSPRQVAPRLQMIRRRSRRSGRARLRRRPRSFRGSTRGRSALRPGVRLVSDEVADGAALPSGPPGTRGC